uniref:Uncharacterized protein n=1 Tax=Echinococcus canadensis TaxID=519352 RepID=A0A915EUN3_9CEST
WFNSSSATTTINDKAPNSNVGCRFAGHFTHCTVFVLASSNYRLVLIGTQSLLWSSSTYGNLSHTNHQNQMAHSFACILLYPIVPLLLKVLTFIFSHFPFPFHLHTSAQFTKQSNDGKLRECMCISTQMKRRSRGKNFTLTNNFHFLNTALLTIDARLLPLLSHATSRAYYRLLSTENCEIIYTFAYLKISEVMK